jgi:hypothetical protein
MLTSAGLIGGGLGGRLALASAADAPSLVVYGDTVEGGKNVPKDQTAERSCVLSSRFPRNAEIVWRMRVIDPATGQPMDDTQLDKVEVTLSDGKTVALKYSGHPAKPKPRDFYWAGAWLIPKDYPTGTLSYSVKATAKDGRSGEYKPFDIPSSLPTITDQVLQDVAEAGG